MNWHIPWHFVVPVALDTFSHLWIGGLFLLWWATRYAGEEDEAIRAQRLALEDVTANRGDHPDGAGQEEWYWTTRRPGSVWPSTTPRQTPGRRFPKALAALVIVGILGTAIPIVTVIIAARVSPQAAQALPPPPEGEH